MSLRYSIAALAAFLLAPSALAQDLTISATAENASGAAGDRVTLDYTASLTGAEEIEDVSVGFYFSTDQTLSSDDVLSEREEVDTESDEPESDNEQIDIPNSLADGDYFILVVIDDQEQVTESDETNNTAAIPFAIGGGGSGTGGGGGANLTATSVSAEPASGAAGTEVEGEYALANTGSEQAGESSVGFYLSTDAQYSSNDTFLTREDADEVDADGDGDGDFEFTVPSSLQPGDYFLIARADDRNDVTETDESDNTASTPFTIAGDGGGGSGDGDADLRIASASVSPTSGDPGSDIELSYTLENAGATEAGETQIGIYISTDRNLSSNDVLVTRLDADGVDANGSEDSDEDALVPNNLSAGDYFVLFVADDRNTVSESRESNNVEAVPFTVTGAGGSGDGQADLRITEAEVEPQSGAPNDVVELDFSVVNQGTGDAGASTVQVYLSSDNSLSSSDMALISDTVQPLSADSDADGEFSITVPDVAPGNYFLIVTADNGNDVAESRESNNTRAVPFEVLMPTASENVPVAGLRFEAVAPNPVGASARVEFSLDAAGPVRLSVVDLLGREVAVLADGAAAAGANEATLNADALAPGVYVLRLQTADAAVTQTVTVVR